ncbi:Uncharacterised protein [Vibrio cholerae]|nr:Uncharacterised protein [Vibrio cholerae]
MSLSEPLTIVGGFLYLIPVSFSSTERHYILCL